MIAILMCRSLHWLQESWESSSNPSIADPVILENGMTTQGIVDPKNLNLDQQAQLFQIYAFILWIVNHDDHAENFIMTEKGNLIGINFINNVKAMVIESYPVLHVVDLF